MTNKFTFIKSIIVADKVDGVGVFEHNNTAEGSTQIFNEAQGGISTVRHTIADMFNSILTQVETLNMGKNKNILIHYDKLTVLKRQIHTSLILLIICETEGIDVATLYDVADEVQDNFKEIDKTVERIDKND